MNHSTEQEEIYSPQDDLMSEIRVAKEKSPEKIKPDFQMLVSNRSTLNVKYED